MDKLYWKRLSKNAAERFVQTVEENKKFYFDAVSQLLEARKPAERKAFYDTLDWNEIRHLDGDLWARLSKDALSLAKEEQEKRFEELKQWERRNFVEAAAFRPTIQPFGYLPQSSGAAQLGLNRRLPLNVQ